MGHILLTIVLSLAVTGGAALSARTEGVSGPIAWKARDFRVTQRQSPLDVEGKARDRYSLSGAPAVRPPAAAFSTTILPQIVQTTLRRVDIESTFTRA